MPESSSYGPVELVLVGSGSQAEGQGQRAEVVVRPGKERDGCQHVGRFCWGTFGCTDKRMMVIGVGETQLPAPCDEVALYLAGP